MNGVTTAAEPARGRRGTSKNEEKTGFLWWTGQNFSWLLLLTVPAVAAAMIVVPRLGGATAYIVLTGSMEPGMPPSSLAVDRPVDPATQRTGGANRTKDPTVVPEQIRGSLWYQLPWLGHINSALTGAQRQWLSIAAVTGLLCYPAFMAVSALRDRRERTRIS